MNYLEAKNALAGTKISTSRLEFLEKMGDIPAEIVNGLRDGSLKFVDFVAYSAKNLAGATTKELMEAADNQKEGICNVNNRKMEAIQYFCVKGIRLQSAVISGTDAITDTTIATAAFTTPSAGVLNGDLEIAVAGKPAFPRCSCGIFSKSDSAKEGLKGYYELDNAFVVAPLSEIVPTLRLNSGATTTREVVRIELYGTKIVSA